MEEAEKKIILFLFLNFVNRASSSKCFLICQGSVLSLEDFLKCSEKFGQFEPGGFLQHFLQKKLSVVQNSASNVPQ